MLRNIQQTKLSELFPAIQEKLNLLKETVADHAEHLAVSKDKDARIGHKTADTIGNQVWACFRNSAGVI